MKFVNKKLRLESMVTPYKGGFAVQVTSVTNRSFSSIDNPYLWWKDEAKAHIMAKKLIQMNPLWPSS